MEDVDDATPELTLDYIRYVLAEDIRSEAGPGQATRVYNQAFIKTFRENDGLLPGDLAHAPWMLLTTTGARSGKKRTIPLTYFERDGRFLIVASKGGALTHPAWFHNLVANSGVVAEYGGQYGAVPVNATAIVLDGDERDEVFAWIKAQNATFAKYESRTDRTIPVVELCPDAAG